MLCHQLLAGQELNSQKGGPRDVSPGELSGSDKSGRFPLVQLCQRFQDIGDNGRRWVFPFPSGVGVVCSSGSDKEGRWVGPKDEQN